MCMCICPTGRVRLTVSLLDGSGRFEICESDAPVVEGHVRRLDSPLGPTHDLLMETAQTHIGDTLTH